MASSCTMANDDNDFNHPESSPDPLAASINERRARRTLTRATKQPLVSSSPSKQNCRPGISEMEFSSPSKQMVLSTPRTGGASPWRIKVTVEAEPGSDDENVSSPTVKHVTRTKTTTIPLKDPDASSPAKRRGRPRKSEAAARRNGTPVRKRASSKARRSSVGADASAADVETDATPKKRRGRPRKNVQPPTENAVPGTRVDTASATDIADEAPPAVPQVALPGIEGPSATPQEPRATSEESPRRDVFLADRKRQKLVDIDTPLKSTPRQTDLTRRLKARKSTPAAKGKELVELSSDEESVEEGNTQTPSGTDEEDQVIQEQPPQQPAEDLEDDGGYEDEHNEINFAFDEGATRMPDDTTIIDSENFSMISVDSLPSMTSPVNGPTETTPAASDHTSIRNHAYLRIPSTDLHGRRSPKTAAGPCPEPLRATQPLAQANPSPPIAPPRYKTPSMESGEPSNPPAIEPARVSPTEAATPKIGRVVKAGFALQGVLDPSRVTPEAGLSKTVDERRDQLDDLFRGFSERTRRELQAGLRLGEQLAKQSESEQSSSLSLSSPTKPKNRSCVADDVFAPETTQQQSRLLTPEDQGDYTASVVPPIEVEYPTLHDSDQRSHLLSPASSPERQEDEMSWRVDTPPVQPSTQEAPRSTGLHAPREAVIGRESPDIWEEEASRSSESLETGNVRGDKSLQSQDLFSQEGPIKLAHWKLPGTWRRKSSGNFQYSDEAQDSQVGTPPSTESDEVPAPKSNNGKGQLVQPATSQEQEDEYDEGSDGSDDTGMFFQSNMPRVFSKKRSTELRRKRAEKLDLSLLLGESLLPESSPPAPVSRTPLLDQPNPFLNTPPQFAALCSSPMKSSPLRRELRNSDISSESAQQDFEESTLPMPPSSPFHTLVEGDTARSMASDQRQLLHEIAGTDSSLRRIRDEADDYLDAYEPQERSLQDVTEVTEPSRTWNRDTTIPALSPPVVKRTFEESLIQSKRTHTPLFEKDRPAEAASSALPTQTQTSKSVTSSAATKASIAVAPHTEKQEPAQPSAGIFSRLSSNLWSKLGNTPPQLAHPMLEDFDHLPKIEPWTLTHYKTLDRLYQLYHKQPAIFSPTSSPTAELNTTLLNDFLSSTSRRFVGAHYRAWGYNVIINESLVVLCAVYTKLLTLQNISEYERKAGKEIRMGDCAPGVAGTVIEKEEVVRRLATVIMGERQRRDERRGKRVDKSGRLSVVWPE